jgi:ABC-2 type transport system ATP-binding protein
MSPSSDLALRTERLSRRFGRSWALDSLDLEIQRGSTVAVLGPNGAGKTTLFRVLATLLRPSTGHVEVFGSVLPRHADAVRSRTGMLTAAGYVYDELTGLENLRFAALMSGERPDLTALRAAIAEVGLEEAADKRVRAYSAGMRKRLELARLMLRRLELVLLDEPFVSLDQEGVELVQAAIQRWKAAGGTVLVASHQVADALRHADRALLLTAGRLERDAPAVEWAQP